MFSAISNNFLSRKIFPFCFQFPRAKERSYAYITVFHFFDLLVKKWGQTGPIFDVSSSFPCAQISGLGSNHMTKQIFAFITWCSMSNMKTIHHFFKSYSKFYFWKFWKCEAPSRVFVLEVLGTLKGVFRKREWELVMSPNLAQLFGSIQDTKAHYQQHLVFLS